MPMDVKAILQHCWTYRSQLLVASTMLGSAFVMKLAPAFDLLPSIFDDFEKEQMQAFDLFAKTPLVAKVLNFIGLPTLGFVVVLAAIELLFAQFLLVSSLAILGRMAGAWLMIEMIGAEYCLRMSGFHHKFAEGYETIETWGMTVLHLFLFYHGYRLAMSGYKLAFSGFRPAFYGTSDEVGPLGFGTPVLAAIYKLLGPIVQKVTEFMSNASAKVCSRCGRRASAPADESAPGKAATLGRVSKKRDDTPPALASTTGKVNGDASKKKD